MSAREALAAQVMTHLDGRASLDPLRFFDPSPARAALPYGVIEEPVLTDWSTATWTGFEGRLVIVLHDGGERPTRVRRLMGLVEAAMMSLPPDLPEGWRLVRCQLVRGRVARVGEQWRATSEWVVRMYRMDS